jgi:hypothetical protein
LAKIIKPTVCPPERNPRAAAIAVIAGRMAGDNKIHPHCRLGSGSLHG